MPRALLRDTVTRQGRQSMAVPAAPTGLNPNGAGWIATPRAQTAVTLAWQAVPAAQSYAVRVEDLTVPDLRDARNDCAGDPHFVCKNFLAGLSYPITARVTARAGHAYRWWVHAIN